MDEWSHLSPVTAYDGPSNALEMAFEIEPHAVVCQLRGDIDIGNASALAPALLPTITPGDGAAVIDIAAVDFFDSNFLRALLMCERTLERDGIDLKVRNAGDRARRLFEITHLERLLE